MSNSGPGFVLVGLLVCFLIVGCASSGAGGRQSQAAAKVDDLYGLRAPESWELVPESFEMRQNNLRLRSACAVLTKVGREITMVAWRLLIWQEIQADESCVELLSADKEGEEIAKRAVGEERVAELSTVCHQTERRVLLDLTTERLAQGRLGEDTAQGLNQLAACQRWAGQ